jgi:hypothetical protein
MIEALPVVNCGAKVIQKIESAKEYDKKIKNTCLYLRNTCLYQE